MDTCELVSIITPCFNSELFIAQTIESVINQTYSNWEMVIIDDCSTDHSADIILSYVERDSRIRYLKMPFPSGSASLPRNRGIELAKGRYIAFLDSDDIWYPRKLEMQIPLFQDMYVAIVYSWYEKMSEQGEKANRIVKSALYHTYETLLYGNEIGCLTCVVDSWKVGKCFFKRVGHEDYELWLSILKRGFIAKNCNEVLASYRVRQTSLSSNKLKAIRWVWNIYQSQGINVFSSIYYLLFDIIKSFVKFVK